jgi:hypothetical protein
MTRDFHCGTHVEYFRFDEMDHISLRDAQGNNGLWLCYSFINLSLRNGNIYNIQLVSGSCTAKWPNYETEIYLDTNGEWMRDIFSPCGNQSVPVATRQTGFFYFTDAPGMSTAADVNQPGVVLNYQVKFLTYFIYQDRTAGAFPTLL